MPIVKISTINDDEREYERENVNEWVRFAFKIGMQSAFHPLEMSKTLIQVI
jgi:hypothetical protein